MQFNDSLFGVEFDTGFSNPPFSYNTVYNLIPLKIFNSKFAKNNAVQIGSYNYNISSNSHPPAVRGIYSSNILNPVKWLSCG